MEKDVKKRFDSASSAYETDSFVERDRSARLVSKLVDARAKDIILDIGCGPGKQIIALSHFIKLGIGIDISDGMLAQAAQNARNENRQNVEFYSGTFKKPDANINLREKGITKIISNYAMHHLNSEEKKQAIAQMITIAGPGLKTIVIGDLMFFENPENNNDAYADTGYVPGIDNPSTVEELAACFSGFSFQVTIHKLHTVVGVLVANKTKEP